MVRPPPVPTTATVPGRVERGDAAEQRPRPRRCRRARRTRRADAGVVGADAASRPRAPRRPSGSGSDHAPHVERRERLGDLADDREEDLLAEQPRVVEVAVVDLAVAAVAVEERVRAGDAGRRASRCRRRRRRARTRPRRRRSAPRSRCPGPGRSASDATTSAIARRAGGRSRRPPREQRLHPGVGRARAQRARRPLARSRAPAARKAWLGPSANGGRVVPHHSPSTLSASRPAAASARVAASPASVSVSSSGAQTATWPRPPRPQAAPTSAAARRSPGAAAPTPSTRTVIRLRATASEAPDCSGIVTEFTVPAVKRLAGGRYSRVTAEADRDACRATSAGDGDGRSGPTARRLRRAHVRLLLHPATFFPFAVGSCSSRPALRLRRRRNRRLVAASAARSPRRRDARLLARCSARAMTAQAGACISRSSRGHRLIYITGWGAVARHRFRVRARSSPELRRVTHRPAGDGDHRRERSLGEVAVAIGWVHSLVPEPQGHGLAVLERRASCAIIWIMSLLPAREGDCRRLVAAQRGAPGGAGRSTRPTRSSSSTSTARSSTRARRSNGSSATGRASSRSSSATCSTSDYLEQGESRCSRMCSPTRAQCTWIEIPIKHASGEYRWFEVGVTNLLDDPAVHGLVCNMRDITERRDPHEQLTFQAYHDALTRLPNRWLLRRAARAGATAGARRRQLRRGALPRRRPVQARQRQPRPRDRRPHARCASPNG